MYPTCKKHWRILHTAGLMRTELKKGFKRGRDSYLSNAYCRGNCIPKQPMKFSCRDFSRCLTKTQHNALSNYRDCALKNVNCPAIRHIEGPWIIKSLRRQFKNMYFAVIKSNYLSRIENLLYICKELRLLISFN